MTKDQYGREINPYDLEHVADVISGKRVPQTDSVKRNKRLAIFDDPSLYIVGYIRKDKE